MYVGWVSGTLGFLVSVTMKIVPCQPYVRIEYMPFKDQKESVKAFDTLSHQNQGEGSCDFLEALAYSHSEMVVMPATFASKVKTTLTT